MKKSFIVIALLAIMMFSGCGIAKDEATALKSLGLAYSSGDYTMNAAYCTGFISNRQTEMYLSVPVAKRFLDGQRIKATSVNLAALRANGVYINSYDADLTPYIQAARFKNDGSILFIVLKNDGKWKGSDNKVIPNNISFDGIITVSFSVIEP